MNKELERASPTDRVNGDKWNDSMHLRFFQERLDSMRSKKSKVETEFRNYEAQETAGSYYDNYGALQAIPPLEQNLTEIYMGRTNGKVTYDIVPDSQADIEELMPTKYAMQYFIDGNGKDNFWKENKDFRHNKATYGTGIYFTGIRNYKDVRHTIKEDASIQNGTDILSKSNYDEYINETWFFFPKSIHPMDYYHDDAAYGNPDLQYAEDCIYKEKVSFTEFKLMFGENKAVNKEVYKNVTSGTDIQERNNNSQSIHQEEIILYYYYNRVTKDYYIVANELDLLYRGIYRFDDGKLPFASAQHYPNNNSFWGRGIPERIGYLKIFKGEMLQDIMQGAAMANSVNLLTSGDDQIGQDWEVGGRGVNIWRSTGGIEKTQRMDTSINLGYFSSVLQIIDDLVVQDTGDNPRAPSQAQSDKVGIVEIMEANKAVRQSSVDEGYNICLDDALTMMLDRIKMFAPALLSEKILGEDGDVLKVIYPQIRIENAETEVKKGQLVITEKMGKFGYFDLKPKNIKGAGVKVQTSSTSSILPILERQKVTEYINNISSLANVAQFIPELGKKLNEYVDAQGVLDWMGKSYGYDTKLSAYTDKDKKAQEQKAKIAELTSKLTPPQNEQIPQAPTQDPNVPQTGGLGESNGGATGL